MSLCKLIADTRERNVLRHKAELSETTLQVEQITTGDYVVLSPANSPLAVIERKPLEDYAASLKDGRHDNKSKLCRLREETGCRIIYLIEGREFPGINETFARVPYKAIESSIFHLMVRDNITVMRSRDTLMTAQLLARFVRSMDSLCVKSEVLVEAKIAPLESLVNARLFETAEAAAVAVAETANQTNETTLVTACAETISPTHGSAALPCDTGKLNGEIVSALLTARHAKSDAEILREMWSVFRGISVESAVEYSRRWSLADLLCKRVSEKDIHSHKLASGRKISAKLAKLLCGEISAQTCLRLLSSIPGISARTAQDLLAETTLPQLLSYTAETISMRHVGKLRRGVGVSRAESILRYFNLSGEVL